MATTITLTHYDLLPSEDICTGHNGWPVHSVQEHDRLTGVRPYSEIVRCSVCDLEWGGGAVSQHESCRLLTTDGTRHAYARSEWQRGDEIVEITYTDPYV